MTCPASLRADITRLDHGGSATNTLVTIEGLSKQGFSVELIYGLTRDNTGSLRETLQIEDISYLYLPEMVRSIHPKHDRRAYKEILAYLKSVHVDIIHTHSSKAGVLGRLAARKCGIPVVHTPHGHVFYGYFNPILSWIYILIERWMARCTARLISLTDLETRQGLARHIGKKDQYITIPSGIPVCRFQQIPSELGMDFRVQHEIRDEFIWLSVGRLTAIKGFDILLKAFATLENEHMVLVIVGDGEEKKALHKLAKALGLENRVKFTGECENIRPALSAANAFVLASRNEGMGRVFIEAMASGLPVVGTEVGGVPEVIEPHVSGLLVPPENPVALAAAMKEMVENQEMRHEMGLHAAASVYPKYDQETMVNSIAQVYRDVLQERASS